MEYSSEELSKVRIKTPEGKGIHELDLHIDILEVVPELKKLENFAYGFFGWANTENGRIIARNKIIRYINFMYSRDLTCIKEAHAKSYRAQKVECAILAGFEYDPATGRFEPLVEEMLQCLNKITNRMIIAFCRHNYYDDEAALTVMRELYSRRLADALHDQTAEPEDISKWEKASDAIENMKKKILNGDENRILTAALVKKIEEEGLGWRPEDIAFRIKDGEDPMKGYEFYKDEILGP